MMFFTRRLIVKNRYAINTFTHNTFTQGGTKDLIMIENLITGDCDYPIVYPNGGVGFDYPEKWPKYFKAALYRFISNRK